MTLSALILLLYERVLPGGQLVNRIEDLGYRVKVIADPDQLVATCRTEKPLLVMVDLEKDPARVKRAVRLLKGEKDVSHLPVIAYGADGDSAGFDVGPSVGPVMVVTDAAILAHMDQLMEQALHIE